MSFRELADKVRRSIDAQLEQRAAQAAIVLRVSTAVETENREPSESESNEVRAAQAEISTIDNTITDLRERATAYEREADIAEAQERDARARGEQERNAPGRVGNEPATYSRATENDGVSFFRDLAAVQGVGISVRGASERQQRYSSEIQERAVSTSTFAGIIPPQYLVDDAAAIARAGRPIANSVRKLPLPAEGMQLVIPRGTVGTAAAVQPTENSNVASQDEVWANLTVPVITVAGQQDVSRQSLERGTPGIDTLIFADLAAAYAVALDVQVIAGTGASGQALGILGTAGITAATTFSAAVTSTTFLTKIAGAIAAVETTRYMPPDVIFMHPRRWAWLLQTVDASSRPLIVPNANGPHNAIGTFDGNVAEPSGTPVGSIQGIPVVTDANLPTNLGTGTNQDTVIVARWEDLLLWEAGDGSPTDLRFEQTLGNQLTVKLVAYGYAAFTAGRYPGAVALVGGGDASGQGLVAPTF